MSLTAELFRREEADPDVLVLHRAEGSAFSGRGLRSEDIGEASLIPRAFPPWTGSSRRRQDDPDTWPPEAGAARIGEAGHASRPPYWLVARRGWRDTEILIINDAGKVSTLPVFGFEEGAMEFIRWCTKESGWRARPIGIGALLSVLHGSCAEVKRVALDPSPEIVAERAIVLISLSRQRFVDSLLGRGRPWFEDRYLREEGAHQ